MKTLSIWAGWVALVALTACGGGSSGSSRASGGGSLDSVAPAFVVNPFVRMPNPLAPLVADLAVQATEDVDVKVVGSEPGGHKFVIKTQQALDTHNVMLLGMRADKTYSLAVTMTDRAGNKTELNPPLTYTTAPLPSSFPTLVIEKSRPNKMEPGVTLMGARTPSEGFLTLHDDEGEVIWCYCDPDFRPDNYELLRNGNILVTSGFSAIELNLYGETVNHWWAGAATADPQPAGSILVNTDSFHHEFLELPEGSDADFLTLSTELREYPDYPADEIDPSITTPVGRVVGDIILEFKRDGTIVRETSLLDLLDPYRLTYDSLLGFYNFLYGAPSHDWTHGNAVIIDPHDDSYIISLRHQDALVKIDRATGALRWILGDPARWQAPWDQYLLTPSGADFEWSYHHHAPEVTGPGKILLYDNGNRRVVPPLAPPPVSEWYSRAVEYEVDEASMTVKQIWQYRADPDIFSGFLGDADYLVGTGNVLICDGAIEVAAPVFKAHVVEVTRDDPPVRVFEAFIEDANLLEQWTLYRAERLSLIK